MACCRDSSRRRGGSKATEIRNIGLLAHVDAGKTTTTEQLLYLCGRIRAVGRVDDGTAQSDWLDVERARGISVRAATTSLVWRGCSINLIDTPGHVDFAGEVERALRVLDGAVLLVSGAEGVQAHTLELWRALRARRLPTLIFANKMDRVGADAEAIVADIRSTLGLAALPVQRARGSEAAFIGVDSLLLGPLGEPLAAEWQGALAEVAAESDEQLLEAYVGHGPGALSPHAIAEATASASRMGSLFPILFGSAKNGIGMRELLDAVVDMLPAPRALAPEAEPAVGLVFKVERDESVGRMAYVRLFSGHLSVRDSLVNLTRGTQEKVAMLRRMNVRKHDDIQHLGPGDIAAVVGLNQAQAGDIVCGTGADRGVAASYVPPQERLCMPLLTVSVTAADPLEYPKLVEALHTLADEDPLLALQWVKETRELTLSVLGPVQVEVLGAVLGSRFGVRAVFGEPAVVYRETPASSAHGHVAYTMPKPCWAILSFLIEPGVRGSGLAYECRKIRAERMAPSYQNEVARRVPEALEQGLCGWQVTDLKVTLLDGEHHIFHTHPLDFAVATPMGVLDGLRSAGTRLLEPILAFRATVPEDAGGRVMSDVGQMRGTFGAPHVSRGRMVIEGELPLATSMTYAATLSSLTKGLGSLAARFSCYREAPPGTEAVRPRRGVDPLDTAKYILWARSALGDRSR